MAKKLGILALVVCMLLSVAVVASAETSCDGNGNPYKAIAGMTTKLHFYEKLVDDKTEVCDQCGALWAGHKVTEDGNCPDKKTKATKVEVSTLRTKATDAASLPAVDKAVCLETFDGAKDTGADKTEESLTAAKGGKNKSWKLHTPEVHQYGQAASGAVYHRTCVYCGAFEYATDTVEHSWAYVKPSDDKRTSCTEGDSFESATSLEKVYCTVCGHKNDKNDGTIKVPALGHDWQYKEILQSCTTGGGKGDVCARCGKLAAKDADGYDGDNPFKANSSDPLGHEWKVKTFGTPVAAGTVGYQGTSGAAKENSDLETAMTGVRVDSIGCKSANIVFVCTRSGCTKSTDEKAKKANGQDTINLNEVTVKEGTTWTGGKLEVVDGQLRMTITSPKDHAWGDKTAKPATCELKGRDTMTCAVCGLEVITNVYKNVNALGHTPDGKFRHDATTHQKYSASPEGQTKGGSKHYQLCSVCGKKCAEEYCDEQEKDKKANWTDNIVKISANCTTGASVIYECKACGYKENVVDPDGKKKDAEDVKTYSDHYGYYVNGATIEDEAALAKWTTKKVTAAAACNKPGTAEYTCKNCGKVALTKAIPGEHDFVMQSTTLTDCTQQWVEIWICSREDCPGVSVKPAESGEETLHDDVKLTWTATITTDTGKEDGRVVQRRIYTAQKAHDFTNPKYEVVKEPTCVQNGERYPLCNICGKKGPKDDEGFKATGVHDYTAKDALVPADCTHPERKGQICKMCGQPKPGTQPEDVENSKPLGHDYANPLYFVGTDVDAAEADAREADYADLAVAKPTECDKAYVVRTDCTRCDAFNIEKHPAGSHSWSKERVHKAPTCDENDRDVYVCTVCGTENPQGKIDNYQNAGGFGIADESLKATGHDYGAYEVLPLSASAAANQTKHVRTCKTCGHKDEDACVYDKNKDESKDATCVNVSVTAMTCKTCKNTYMVYGVDLDPDNHDFEQVPVEGREPTCTEIGLVLETCPNCGATGRTIEIKGLGHAWERATGNWTTGLVITQEPTCVADGVAHRVCEFCGLTTEDFTVGKYDGANTQFGHTWTRADYVWSADQLIVDVEPTCTVDGTGHYVCADCGYELTTGIPHYAGADTEWGHIWSRPDYVWSFDQLHITTQPTCTKDGEGYYECTDCGRKMVVPVPHYDGANTPYGHAWEHEPWPVGLKQHEDGSYYYECPDCGYIVEAE